MRWVKTTANKCLFEGLKRQSACTHFIGFFTFQDAFHSSLLVAIAEFKFNIAFSVSYHIGKASHTVHDTNFRGIIGFVSFAAIQYSISLVKYRLLSLAPLKQMVSLNYKLHTSPSPTGIRNFYSNIYTNIHTNKSTRTNDLTNHCSLPIPCKYNLEYQL